MRHTRLVQDWLAEGRQEGLEEGEARGEARGEAKVTLRLLNRRCGPLTGFHHRPDQGLTSGSVGSPGCLAGCQHLSRHPPKRLPTHQAPHGSSRVSSMWWWNAMRKGCS